MNALIYAAGYGKRLRPLTDSRPKPLIEVGGLSLLERHIRRLAAAGFHKLVVNTAHLAEQIHDFVGDGSRWGLRIHCSHEGEEPLETGGGMLRALPWLGTKPFLAINADILCDYPLEQLPDEPSGLAHLVLVDNPPWKTGDFGLESDRVTGRDVGGLTFAGIGVYRPQLLDDCTPGCFSLVPLLEAAMASGQVSGEHYRGLWMDIGTPDRLREARGRFGETENGS